MRRLIWQTESPSGPWRRDTSEEMETDSRHENPPEDEEIKRVLGSQVDFLAGPTRIPPSDLLLEFSAAEDGDSPEEEARLFADVRYYHGLIEGDVDARKALRILEALSTQGAVVDFVVETDVRPPPPDPGSPRSEHRVSFFERWKRDDFTHLQTYLEDPPHGVGARHAWTFDGGRGEGVTLVDLERGFHRGHEDLQRAGQNAPNAPDDAHGTMSLGVCCADDNALGITGIAPGARPEFREVRGKPVLKYEYPIASAAIRDCVARLDPGDVILVELQAGYLLRSDHSHGMKKRVLPIERSPDVAAVIRAATKKNIYVIEPAGNPHEIEGLDLSDPGLGLPSDTGGIVVGAGIPGTLDWKSLTNHGDRVDVHGWGEKVVSTASAKSWADFCRKAAILPTFAWKSRCYTSRFNGTSSAAAMVAGIIACLSGIVQANGYGILTPKEMRDLLVKTGAPSKGVKKIGPLPDLKKAIAELQVKYGPLRLTDAG